ncbi:transcriptional regulator [Ottowia sp.]|uniref:transcriptional regulator n=1 Tax=Ottowia sp. TaxID=1898956 RepID=UPI003A845F49
MQLLNYLQNQGHGSIATVARAMGVTHVVIHFWATKKRPIPVNRCAALERVTNGAVTRQEMRDDWADHWPELATLASATAGVAA